MYRIAAIGGDGIGPEIVSEGKKVLDAAGERFDFDIRWTDFDIGADRYLSNREPADRGRPGRTFGVQGHLLSVLSVTSG